jgi:hypothetical protein
VQVKVRYAVSVSNTFLYLLSPSLAGVTILGPSVVSATKNLLRFVRSYERNMSIHQKIIDVLSAMVMRKKSKAKGTPVTDLGSSTIATKHRGSGDGFVINAIGPWEGSTTVKKSYNAQ